MVLVLGFVTARSRIFSHRTTAHGPHKTASSAGPMVHSPAGDRIVATPSAIEMSPAVRAARCLVRHPRQLGQHQQARSRRPNIPAVQPCEGSPRSAASTASRSLSVGWKGSPVGRPSAARTATDSPGRSYPAAVWWWSMAATRHRWVAGAAGHPVRKSTTVCGSAGQCGGVGGGAPVGEQRPVRGVGRRGSAPTTPAPARRCRCRSWWSWTGDVFVLPCCSIRPFHSWPSRACRSCVWARSAM